MSREEYNIGDYAWVKHNNKPEQVKIVGKMRERGYFTYEFRSEKTHGWAGSAFIFKTKEEVI